MIGLWFEGKKRAVNKNFFCILQVLLPGVLKYFREYLSPRKLKYGRKYFSMWIQGPGTIDSWKKPELKNIMLLSL